jgi:hypothetical protein
VASRSFGLPGAGSAEEPGVLQRPGQACVEPSRGLEDPPLPLVAPTGVQNSLLHLRSSWKVSSSIFEDELLRLIDNARRAVPWPPNPAKVPMG